MRYSILILKTVYYFFSLFDRKVPVWGPKTPIAEVAGGGHPKPPVDQSIQLINKARLARFEKNWEWQYPQNIESQMLENLSPTPTVRDTLLNT